MGTPTHQPLLMHGIGPGWPDVNVSVDLDLWIHGCRRMDVNMGVHVDMVMGEVVDGGVRKALVPDWQLLGWRINGN